MSPKRRNHNSNNQMSLSFSLRYATFVFLGSSTFFQCTSTVDSTLRAGPLNKQIKRSDSRWPGLARLLHYYVKSEQSFSVCLAVCSSRLYFSRERINTLTYI